MKKATLSSFMITSLFLLTFSSNTLAVEKYPAREIRIVMSSSPGGTVDQSVRLMSDNLAKNLGVPIVVENRRGAGGVTGTLFMVKSKPDGYTIGAFAARDTVLNPAILPVPYKYTDLVPLCKFAETPLCVLSRGDAPWKSWKDLVADAKKRPNKITYGVSTNSITAYQIGGYIKAEGISLIQIPLADVQQAIVRVTGGNIDIVGAGPTPALELLIAGTLRMLLLISPERMPLFPQVPTYKEMGYPDPIISLYSGFFVPVGVPKPIRETLEKALEKTLADPKLKKKCEEIGMYVKYLPSEAFAKKIAENYKQVVEFAKSSGAGK